MRLRDRPRGLALAHGGPAACAGGRVQVGTWTKPFKQLPLELGVNFTWVQNVASNRSTLYLKNVRTDYYSDPPALIGLLGALPQPDIDATVHNVSLSVPQIASLTGGARYAKKLTRPVGRWGDRMSTELFDLEVNGVASFSHVLHRIDVKIPPATVNIPSPRPDLAPDSTLVLPSRITLQHHWRNQWALRMGGDYNVLPGFMALRLGYSFESDAVSPGYHQLDFLPLKRHGLYAGGTVRIAQRIDVSASYAYFIVPKVANTVQNAQLRRSTSGSPEPGDNTIHNAGTFTQSASMLILEVGLHL